ncbi:organic cation transporter protein-like [Haliotis rubra]|uniref:organic cation transporter protein-like n=1 Tax=Haliotis rubra TaxID=36100 RepID=UPI001EE518E4|nr:organic cation transporter protein-like [Haliotis rubra]
MKFDTILEHLGEFGPYQKRMYLMVCIPAITCAFQSLLPVFTMAFPNFRCAVPGLANDTYQSQGQGHGMTVNGSIPWERNDDGVATLSQCNVYKNLTAGNQTQECTSWVYDKTTFTSTTQSEFNIVCDNKGWRATSNSIAFAGRLTGAFVFGLSSDLFGRKITFFLGVLLHSACGIGIAFSHNMMTFNALRFTEGMADSGLYMVAYVIGMEFIGPSKRVIAGMVIDLFWCLGLFILGAVAYFLRDWQHLQLALSAPSALMLIMWWFIPESPRWLMSRGRDAEAEMIIRKAAEVNGVDLPPSVFTKSSTEKNQPQGKVWEMFTTPRLLVRCLIVFFNWLVVSMVYYGLGLNVQNLSGDIYLNFTIANIMETVAYVLCIILLDRTGRKKLHCGSMMLGGIACLATIFPVVYGDNSHVWITTALSMIGKLGASAAFAVIYVFSAELFPTVVRNSAMGVNSVFSSVGGVISPYIADLGILLGGNLKTVLPLIVFGAVSVCAGLLSLLLPETRRQQLPENIEDAKTFGKANNNHGPHRNTLGDSYTDGTQDKFKQGDSETCFNLQGSDVIDVTLKWSK